MISILVLIKSCDIYFNILLFDLIFLWVWFRKILGQVMYLVWHLTSDFWNVLLLFPGFLKAFLRKFFKHFFWILVRFCQCYLRFEWRFIFEKGLVGIRIIPHPLSFRLPIWFLLFFLDFNWFFLFFLEFIVSFTNKLILCLNI